MRNIGDELTYSINSFGVQFETIFLPLRQQLIKLFLFTQPLYIFR